MKNTYIFQFFAHVNITLPDWFSVVSVDRMPSCAYGVTGRRKEREREALLFSFPFHQLLLSTYASQQRLGQVSNTTLKLSQVATHCD